MRKRQPCTSRPWWERSRSIASLKAMVAAEEEDDTEASASTGGQYMNIIFIISSPLLWNHIHFKIFSYE